MLIESSKSKLVKGLNIEDSHIRKLNKDDKHVCDVCARAKITRHSFNKLHKIRGNYWAIIFLATLLCSKIVHRGAVIYTSYNFWTMLPNSAGSTR